LSADFVSPICRLADELAGVSGTQPPPGGCVGTSAARNPNAAVTAGLRAADEALTACSEQGCEPALAAVAAAAAAAAASAVVFHGW
jgi:hypothetical protein